MTSESGGPSDNGGIGYYASAAPITPPFGATSQQYQPDQIRQPYDHSHMYQPQQDKIEQPQPASIQAIPSHTEESPPSGDNEGFSQQQQQISRSASKRSRPYYITVTVKALERSNKKDRIIRFDVKV